MWMPTGTSAPSRLSTPRSAPDFLNSRMKRSRPDTAWHQCGQSPAGGWIFLYSAKDAETASALSAPVRLYSRKIANLSSILKRHLLAQRRAVHAENLRRLHLVAVGDHQRFPHQRGLDL